MWVLDQRISFAMFSWVFTFTLMIHQLTNKDEGGHIIRVHEMKRGNILYLACVHKHPFEVQSTEMCCYQNTCT